MCRLLGVVSVSVACVRTPTCGRTSQRNPRPFRRRPWVFAHDGEIGRIGEVRALDEASPVAIHSETDGEGLFAFLLTRLASHPSSASSRFVSDMIMARAIEDLSAIPSLGAATFLLSDGAVLYAYCRGRPLFLLERRPHERLEAILVASERVTPEEAWVTLGECTLVVVWRQPKLGWAVMHEGSPSAW